MPTPHTQRAIELHKQGCNCAQAVLGAYCEDFKLPEDTAKCMTAGFGNGLGDTQGICGAVLSGIIVLGLRYGSDRRLVMKKTAEFKQSFREKAGELDCCQLRQGDISCGDLVALAAQLLEC